MITAIPLTIIPLILYNIIGFAFPGTTIGDTWSHEFFAVPLISKAEWALTLGDLMLVVGIITLFMEVMKSAQAGTATITNHMLSTVVLIIYIVEFVAVAVAATSTFFILTLFALFDVIGGFSISIRTAERDVSIGRTIDTQ